MSETYEQRKARLRAEREALDTDYLSRRNRIAEERALADGAKPWFFKPGVDPRQELIFGIGRGVSGALEEAGDGLNAVNTWMNELWDAPHIVFGDEADNGWIGVERYSEMENPEANIFGLAEAIGATVKNAIPETETISGNIIEEGSKFAAGWYATGFLKPVQALKAGGGLTTAGGYMLQGGLTDFAVYDGQEERLSNFLQEFDNPLLNNAVTEYLAADGTDSELEGRMKNILEGGGLGLLADGIVLGIRALKPVQRVKAFNEQRRALQRDREMLDEIDNTPSAPDPDNASPFGFEIEDIAPEVLTASTKSSPGARFVLHESTDGTRVLRGDADNLKEAGMNLHETSHGDFGDLLQSRGMFVPKAVRGQGLGVRLIQEGLAAASHTGRNFASDSEVTEAAMRAYRSLAKKAGYAVQEFDAKLINGTYQSANGGPIFVFTDWPGKLEGAARVDVRKVPLGPSVDITTIRSTVQRIVDSGQTDELIEALSKGDADTVLRLSGNQQHYIDWDSFADDPESLLRFVKSVEDTFDEAITAAKGGKVATEETVAKGLRLLEEQTAGRIPGRLFQETTAEGGLSARVFAGQQLLTESRMEMFRLAEAAKGGDTEAAAKLLQHANTYAVLEAQVTGASSEIARAMRAMQIIKQQRLSPHFDFDEMMREAAMTGDVTKFAKQLLEGGHNNVSRTVAEKLKVTKMDMLLEILYGNLLSAPTTQMVNIIGNAGMTLYDFVARGAAIVPGAAKRLLGGSGPTGVAEFAGSVVGFYRGATNALRVPLTMADYAKFGKSLNWKSLRSGELKQLVMESENVGSAYKALLSGEAQTDVVTKLGEAGSARKAITAALPDDIGSKPLYAQLGHYMKFLTMNTVGPVVRIPGRLILTTDELFKSIARDTEAYSQVWADATMVQRLNGDPRISTAQYAEEMLDIDRHLKFGGETSGNYKRAAEADRAGIDFARRQTFQAPLQGGAVMDSFGRFEKFVTETKGMRLLTPFVRTPVNLMLQTLELTPGAQLLSRRFREELAAGGVRQNKAMAQMALTSGAAFMLYQKFASGELRGTGSGNNSTRLDGVDRYSIKLNGHWVKFDRLDPFGAFIGFSADMFELFESNDLPPGMEEEGKGMFAGMMAAFSGNFVNKTYMRGLSEFFEAMHYAGEGNTKSFNQMVGSTMFNLMPFVGSNFERRRADGQEEFAKYIFDWKDEFISRIPASGGLLGLLGYEGETRADLGIRRDPLGRPIKVKENAGPDSRLWNPIDVSNESTSPLDRALAQLDFHISTPMRSISGVGLDGNQYSKLLLMRGQLVTVAGLTMEERLAREINRPLFQARTPHSKQDRINDIVREYGRKARRELLREDEELRLAVEGASLLRNQKFTTTVAEANEAEALIEALTSPTERLAQENIDDALEALGAGSAGGSQK